MSMPWSPSLEAGVQNRQGVASPPRGMQRHHEWSGWSESEAQRQLWACTPPPPLAPTKAAPSVGCALHPTGGVRAELAARRLLGIAAVGSAKHRHRVRARHVVALPSTEASAVAAPYQAPLQLRPLCQQSTLAAHHRYYVATHSYSTAGSAGVRGGARTAAFAGRSTKLCWGLPRTFSSWENISVGSSARITVGSQRWVSVPLRGNCHGTFLGMSQLQNGDGQELF